MSQSPWGAPPPQQQGWGQPPAQQAPPAWGPPPQQQPAWGPPPAQQQPAWGPPPQQQAPQVAAPARPVDPNADPFAASNKAPNVSFKGAPVGASWTLQIKGPAVQMQTTNFDTGQLDYWEPNEAEKAQGITIGRAKMAAVVNGTVLEGPPGTVGEERSVWAPISSKPGSKCRAISDAQTAAGGERMQAGGTLTLTFVGEEPFDPSSKDRNKTPRKLYSATYRPPGAGSAADAFAGGQPAQQQPPAAPPAQQGWGQPPAQQPPAAPPQQWGPPAQQQPPAAPPAQQWGPPPEFAQPGQQPAQAYQQAGFGQQPAQAPQDAPQGWGGHAGPPAATAPPTDPWGA